ncbi:MAG: ABC transporter permease [Caldilineales bacterium]|nr:ABC transporter permease [Caldilineales bacterium]
MQLVPPQGDNFTKDRPFTGQPVVDITPSKKWHEIDLAGLWRHRDMLLLLVQRDIKVRYKQTFLGVFWAILQPLGPMLVFTLIFTQFLKVPVGEVPYAIFVLSGLVPWTFFSIGISNASNSLVSHASMISKVYFPRLVLPSATTLAGLVDMAVGCGLLFVLLVIYGFPFTWQLALLPIVIACLALLVFAIGLNFAALNTIYRDVRQALPLILQLWMFLTPVIYARTIVPPEWQWLLTLNPVTGLVETFRAVFLGLPIPWSHLGVSMLLCGVFLLTGSVLFVRMEKYLADYL